VPIKPPYYGRVAGPITRSVADAALIMQVLSQPDARDTMSLPRADIAWSNLHRDVTGLRIGLLADAGWGLAVEPETAAAVQAAARAFEAAGAIVEPLQPFTTRAMIDGLDRFWRMRSWLDYSALPPGRQAKVLPYIRDWIVTAAALTGSDVFNGFSQMGAIRDATVAATLAFDFVLSPVSPVPAFTAEWASPINDPQRPFEHIAFTLPFNMSEQPAASINCGFTAGGLPIGLQISSRRFDDLGVLQLARAFEDLRGTQRAWPAPPA
jgi:Asp-tRNA(Asn)/Glu-tRNA(Gln) amidotransferase A subunit family amidase